MEEEGETEEPNAEETAGINTEGGTIGAEQTITEETDGDKN